MLGGVGGDNDCGYNGFEELQDMTQRCLVGNWTFQTGTQKHSVKDSSKEMACGSQRSGELARDRKGRVRQD